MHTALVSENIKQVWVLYEHIFVSKLPRVSYGLAKLARFFPDQVYLIFYKFKQIGYSGF